MHENDPTAENFEQNYTDFVGSLKLNNVRQTVTFH